jgi:peroxiredoxin
MRRLLLCALLLTAPVATNAVEVNHIGEPAPHFTLPDLFGRTISLDYFDNHPGVIIFWSSSSPRSAELLEDCRGYQERWGRNDLAIVAINTDTGGAGASQLKTARDWTDRLNIVFPVLLDYGRAVQAAYGIRDVPAVVVVDAGGRIAAVLQGVAPTLREQLRQSVAAAIDGAAPGLPTPATAAASRDGRDAAAPPAETAAAACGIPRARSCTHIDERDPSAVNPAVMALRLCVCHGDTDAAQIMLSAISKQGTLGPDLRFALAHMMLVKGSTAEARRAFESLRANYPDQGWGAWGLGIVALTEGNAEGALSHFRAARAEGWNIPEVETAVLKYLEGYWRSNRAAPQEEQFLALFEEFNSVRVCYRKLNQRG